MIRQMATAASKMNRAYWRKRAVRQAEQQMQADEELNLGLKREYERILHELDAELAAFYARYAENEGVSYAAARKLLRDAELENFRMTLDEFRDKAIAGGYDKELNEIYLRTRVSRLQALQTQIELRMQELFQNQQELLHDHLAGIYTDTYYQTVYAVSQQMPVLASFARIDTETVEKLLSKPWLGSDFSSRIWADKDKLTRELMQTLSRGFVRGDSLDRMTKEFAQRMGVSQSRAETLIHTESAHAAAEATAKGYKETGVSEYQFDASLDLKTCAVCGVLDGKTFPVSARETGISYPPLHPRCRCTTVPVTEFDAGGQRAARNPVTGKTEYVDQHMTYAEWHKKYVEDDPAGALAEKKYKNRHSDASQHERYLERLGSKNIPKSLDAFQNLKYTEPEKWNELKTAFCSKNGLQQQLSYVYNGEKLFIPSDTKFDTVVTMAGQGGSKPIRVVDRLVKDYGGKAEDWKKQAGKITSSKYVFDVHWYERDDGVQHEMKLKNRTERKR